MIEHPLHRVFPTEILDEILLATNFRTAYMNNANDYVLAELLQKEDITIEKIKNATHPSSWFENFDVRRLYLSRLDVIKILKIIKKYNVTSPSCYDIPINKDQFTWFHLLLIQHLELTEKDIANIRKSREKSGLSTLVGYGAQDIFITTSPQITFNRVVRRRTDQTL